MTEFIKEMRFDERARARLTFSDATKVRLNPAGGLELRKQANGTYPLDADLNVRTWLSALPGSSQILGFYGAPAPGDLPAGTEIGYRLRTGAEADGDMYWNAALSNWTLPPAGVPGAGWSSEADVAAHIDILPYWGHGKIQVIINLRTTDPTVTPRCEALWLAVRTDADWLRSLIADSLMASMGTGLRFTVDMAAERPAGATTVQVPTTETNYNVVAVTSVYNQTTDPSHNGDLFLSYDSATKTATLNGPLAAAATLLLRVTVEPEIIFAWPSAEYTELPRLPAVVIEDVRLTPRQNIAMGATLNRAGKTGRVQRGLLRHDIDLSVALIGESNRSLMALVDRALAWHAATPLLTWTAVDEPLTMRWTGDLSTRSRPSLRGEHTLTYSLRLEDVPQWIGEAMQTPLLTQMVYGLTKEDS